MKDADRTLRYLVANIRPTWWYSTGKEGYECPCCGEMFKRRSEYTDPDGHKDYCAYAEAVAWVKDNAPAKQPD